ncbi:MAG: hypothetical protein HY722_00835 [Planctomycetes bacterium]|nr:hypothetical protein [Planctomycetota bacterium]
MSTKKESGEGDALERARERLEADVRAIVDILATDLPQYVERSVRSRFVSAGAAADALSRQKLARLKAATREAARSTAEKVQEALRPLEAWLLSLPEKRAGGLEALPGVWRVLRTVDETVRAILGQAGIPEGEPLEYRPPAQFIGGVHLKSLVERFWRDVGGYLDQSAAHAARRSEADRTERERRWDEA